MMKIEYKDEAVFHSCCIVPWHPILIDVTCWIWNYCNVEFKPLIITQGWRPPRNKNDVQGTNPLRAIDIRSWGFIEPEKVVQAINRNWQYDMRRPTMMVCVYHDAGSGLHFHIQVHPNTFLIL